MQSETDESARAYRRRRMSHYIVYFTITSSSLFYSALLVSLWPYFNRLDDTGDKQFLGYLAAIGALATTCCCPIFGKWSNKLKSCTLPFVLTLVCGLVHYAIYVSLPTMATTSTMRKWFLLARFMAGMNDVNIGLARGYIAESTTRAERRRAVSIITASQTIAFALGPALQTLAVPLGETGYTLFGGYVRLDMYTSIGWLGLLANTFNVALFHPSLFQHCDMRHTGAHRSLGDGDTMNVYYKSIAWLFILLQFLLICNYLFLKVLGTSLVMDEFLMTRARALEINSYIVAGGALVSLVAIATLERACRRWGEMHVMRISFALMILARFAMYPISKSNLVVAHVAADLGCPNWTQRWCQDEKQMTLWQYVASNALDSFGYAWAISLIYTIFSQLLGSKQQGTWMGLMTSLSGFARIVSPLALSFVYMRYGNAFTVLLTNAVFILTIVATLCMIYYLTTKGQHAPVANDGSGKQLTTSC